MKKVWILESFIGKDQMKQSEDDVKAMVAFYEEKGDQESVETCRKLLESVQKKHSENPDGYWLGYQGKTNYKAFCYESKQTMRNLKGRKFRVLKAEIEDSADTWSGYVNGVENEGVLRYLYATL